MIARSATPSIPQNGFGLRLKGSTDLIVGQGMGHLAENTDLAERLARLGNMDIISEWSPRRVLPLSLLVSSEAKVFAIFGIRDKHGLDC